MTCKSVYSDHIHYFIFLFKSFAYKESWIKKNWIFFCSEKNEIIIASYLSPTLLRFKTEKKNVPLINEKAEDNLQVPLFLTGSDFSNN